jgi:hypothetical protein
MVCLSPAPEVWALKPSHISEFTNVWETAFDVTDTTFDCNVNRTKGDSSTQLYLINHFLDTLVLGQPAPDVKDANVTNGVSGTGSLGQQVATCAAANGRNPNYMLVDVSVAVLSTYNLVIDFACT